MFTKFTTFKQNSFCPLKLLFCMVCVLSLIWHHLSYIQTDVHSSSHKRFATCASNTLSLCLKINRYIYSSIRIEQYVFTITLMSLVFVNSNKGLFMYALSVT